MKTYGDDSNNKSAALSPSRPYELGTCSPPKPKSKIKCSDDMSKEVLCKVTKDSIATDISYHGHSSYSKDYQKYASKMLQENLAGKILAIRNTNQSKISRPSLYNNSIYTSQFKLPPVKQQVRRDSGQGSHQIFGRDVLNNKSTYQSNYVPPKKIVDQTVTPQQAKPNICMPSKYFRGQSTYLMEFINLPKVPHEKINGNVDHLNPRT